MGFETPLALLGLLGIAVPVVLHWMRARPPEAVVFPAIALLEGIAEKARDRRQLTDRALLASRITILTLASLAIASPYCLTAPVYGNGSPLALAIVVDDSMSMTRSGGPSLLQHAIDRASEIARTLPARSQVAVIGGGAPARVLVSRSRDRAAVLARLGELPPSTARGTDLSAAVRLAHEELRGSDLADRRIVVLTDGVRHADAPAAQEAANALPIEFERVGPEHTAFNLAILDATIAPNPLREDVLSISTTLGAFGRPKELEATLRVEESGRELTRKHLLIDSDVVRTTLSFRVPDADAPKLDLIVDTNDAIETDNARSLLFPGAHKTRVLLVDGDPHSDPDRDEVGYLARALEKAPKSRMRFQTTQVDPSGAVEARLERFDVIVLANVQPFYPELFTGVKHRVRQGGGLLITTGDRFDAHAYIGSFGELLPAHPSPSPVHSEVVGLNRDSRVLELTTPTGLTAVRTHRRIFLETPLTPAATLLSFPDGGPALVYKAFGQGRVALFASTFDTDWTDLPLRPGFLPLVTELITTLGGRVAVADGPIAPATTAWLPRPPGSDRLQIHQANGNTAVLRLTAEQTRVAFTGTDTPGAYRVSAGYPERGFEHMPGLSFVVAPPPQESDLTVAPLPKKRVRTTERRTQPARIRAHTAPWLLLGVAAFLLLEALLRTRPQRWLSRPPSIRGLIERIRSHGLRREQHPVDSR